MAPVLPAPTKASAAPSATSFAPTTIDESVLLRAALAGSSPEPITSAAWTISTCARAGDEGAQARLVADEDHGERRRGDREGALDHGLGRVVAAGRVDGDADTAVVGDRAPGGGDFVR